MDQSYLEEVFNNLQRWSQAQDYAGYDPFDGLNSRLFSATRLRHSRTTRLLWTQLIKRSPVNLRPLVRVSPGRNPKGIALFTLAALSRHRQSKTETTEQQCRLLLERLINMKLDGWSGAAWGYNFDWQSRVLFAPRGSPTVVPTAFAAKALLDAGETLGEQRYFDIAGSICDFILQDLRRPVDTENELCFSYSPSSATRVYNASLLAGEVLIRVAAVTNDDYLREAGTRALRYVLGQQRVNGSWTYGADQNQGWVDNFHTAFLLSSLSRITMTGISLPEIDAALSNGFRYWRSTFFLAEGWPKYYDDALYPADTHCAAAAIATLCDLRPVFPEAISQAQQIAKWTIEHLWDPRGFFYYQRRRYFTVRTPFIRWSEAWMLYALARLLEELNRPHSKPNNVQSKPKEQECR
jgi:hypothetical protein